MVSALLDLKLCLSSHCTCLTTSEAFSGFLFHRGSNSVLCHHLLSSRFSVTSASLIPVPSAAKCIQGLRGLSALLQEQPSYLCAHQFLCKALEYPRVDVFGMLLLGMLPPPFCPVGFSQVSVPCGQDLPPATRLFCSCHRAPEICLFLLNKPKTHKVPL